MLAPAASGGIRSGGTLAADMATFDDDELERYYRRIEARTESARADEGQPRAAERGAASEEADSRWAGS